MMWKKIYMATLKYEDWDIDKNTLDTIMKNG